jgi:hypothetical protein
MMSQESKVPEAPDTQGEGNRDAAERYNADTREYVRSGHVQDAARKADGQDPQEVEARERAGKERAKEEDPEVSRHYEKPAEKRGGAS